MLESPLPFGRNVHLRLPQLIVRLVDGAEQLVESRSLIHRPQPVESRAEKAQITPGQEPDRNDAILIHVT
jgi:hypothetical protein